MTKSQLRLERKGTRVQEIFEVRLALRGDDREAFQKNPEEVLTRLVTELGHPVRDIIIAGDRAKFIRDVLQGLPRAEDGGCTWKKFHVVYPEAEASKWIWECV